MGKYREKIAGGYTKYLKRCKFLVFVFKILSSKYNFVFKKCLCFQFFFRRIDVVLKKRFDGMGMCLGKTILFSSISMEN